MSENPTSPADSPPTSFLRVVRVHAERHALIYIIAGLMFTQSLTTAFYDNFWPLEKEDMAKLGWWQILAATGKTFSFAFGTVLGYLIKGPDAPAPASVPKQ